MKKLITLCLFTIALFIGSTSVNAQTDKSDVNAIAAKKTEALRQKIKFSDDQRDEVYKVFQVYTEREIRIKNNPETAEQALSKLNYYRDERFKLIFTEEQYQQYLAMKD
jgi:hypothetical protein